MRRGEGRGEFLDIERGLGADSAVVFSEEGHNESGNRGALANLKRDCAEVPKLP